MPQKYFLKKRPFTGSRAEMQPMQAPASNDASRFGSSAEQNISGSPTPFRAKQGPAMMPAPPNRNAAMPPMSKNRMALQMARGMQKHNPPSVDHTPLYQASEAKHSFAAVGDRQPSGYDKVVGGRLGTSHPSRKGDPGAGQRRVNNFSFRGN